jgi:TetR/AcrR family fatty acid metabolism transcriptional regulator
VVEQFEQKERTFTEVARRAHIIEAAIVAIAMLGYAQASLAQIAKQARISKGLISYHFSGKDELIEQIVEHVYTTGTTFMIPRMLAAGGARELLRTYIEVNVEFIGAHRQEMQALVEIFANFRTAEGKPRFDQQAEEPIIAATEGIFVRGHEEGAFRPFNTRVMAITLRRAIDAVTTQAAADLAFDTESYGRDLADLFDHATRKGG